VTQEKRRCCLLDTEFGLTDEERLWAALSAWTTFQPRKALSQKDPGLLHYPNKFSHVFDKYWDHLSCLDQHPDFASESEYTRHRMTLFSQGISAMASQGTFELRPSAEALLKDVLVTEHSAVSRFRPTQDGPDCWEEHRRHADTGQPGSPSREGLSMKTMKRHMMARPRAGHQTRP
jgi:hypothetical protein